MILMTRKMLIFIELKKEDNMFNNLCTEIYVNMNLIDCLKPYGKKKNIKNNNINKYYKKYNYNSYI